MIYNHFIGRVGAKGAQVINGSKGEFLSMDVATDIYSKGQQVTMWVRVRSNRDNHLKLAKWLTKGRLVLVEGALQEPSIWIDKNGVSHVQLSMSADNVEFVNSGSKSQKEQTDNNNPVVADTKRDEAVPFGPADNYDAAPF